MTITQDRMITMINIAIRFQTALNRLIREITDLDRQIKYDDKSPEYAFSILVAHADEMELLEDAKVTIETLTAEHIHFLRNKNRNNRIKQKLRERRRAAGVPAREQHQPGELSILEIPGQSSAPVSMLPHPTTSRPSRPMPSADSILNSTDPRMRAALKTAEDMLAEKEKKEQAKLDAQDKGFNSTADFSAPIEPEAETDGKTKEN